MERLKAKDMTLIEEINTWTHRKRIAVRELAEAQKLPLPRNLYYDYTKQVWIGEMKLRLA